MIHCINFRQKGVRQKNAKKISKIAKWSLVAFIIGFSGILISSIGKSESIKSNEEESGLLLQKLDLSYSQLCNNGVENVSLPFLNITASECLQRLQSQFTKAEWREVQKLSKNIIQEKMSQSQISQFNDYLEKQNLNNLRLSEMENYLATLNQTALSGFAVVGIFVVYVIALIYWQGRGERAAKEKSETEFLIRDRQINIKDFLRDCESELNLAISKESPNYEIYKMGNARLCLDKAKLIYQE